MKFCINCKHYRYVNDEGTYEYCNIPRFVTTPAKIEVHHSDINKKNKNNDCKEFEQKVSLIRRLFGGKV